MYERRGARRDRNTKAGRKPELGYYLIVTDTKETEKNYFYGIRDSIPKPLRDRLVIKVEKAEVTNLVEKAKEYVSDKEPQYRSPWIVFDRDQVKDFDKIIENASMQEVNVGWSNPCIEIWFFAYFGEIPMISDSVTCCSKFSDKFEKIVKQKYKKEDKNIYKKLVQFGDEENAIEISERKLKQLQRDGKTKPSEMWPGNKLFNLIKEINSKKNLTT